MPPRDRQYMNTSEVASVLGVTTQTIYNWLKAEKIGEPQRNPITKRRHWTPQDVERIRETMMKGSANV
jgi:DNA-binding transcriptional MerR regulator